MTWHVCYGKIIHLKNISDTNTVYTEQVLQHLPKLQMDQQPGFELTVCNVHFVHSLDLNSKNCTSFFQTMCKFSFCNYNNQGLGIIFYVQKEDLGMLFYV